MDEEQQAIARLKQADLAGLEFLVRQYQVQAVQTAYLILGDRFLAEDIAHTAFLKAAWKIDQFDAQRPFRPWFLRMVVNDAIKAAKGQKRLVSLDEPSPAVLAWLNDPAKEPEELAEAADLRQSVWNALAQLSPEQRAVIIQRHFLEMDEAEMVQELQRPPSTVKWWLHTARERLRTLLSPYRSETSGENHEKR
jgi:RNA polymerase sigma-70 factor (ECF subfamily)